MNASGGLFRFSIDAVSETSVCELHPASERDTGSDIDDTQRSTYALHEIEIKT